MTIVILAAVALYAYVLIGRRKGLWPFRGRIDPQGAPLDPAAQGRVDDATAASVWYEAANPLQIPHVQGTWDRRLAVMKAEGRLFMVPGQGGCTTWDHLDTWRPHMAGLTTRAHHLRIVHNHWRHDMDNDAIAVEFASAADHDLFMSRIPEGGPVPFHFADVLSPEGRAEMEGLLGRNRARTAMGIA